MNEIDNKQRPITRVEVPRCAHCDTTIDVYTVEFGQTYGFLCETCIDNGYTFLPDGTLIQANC